MRNRSANTLIKTCIALAATMQLALVTNAASKLSLDAQPYAPIWAWPIWTPSRADPDIVVWVFYRAPQNIPSDFNLLEGFDWTDRDANGVPDPWDYPLLVRGFEIFADANLLPPPSKVILREIDEVPVWFTTREEALQIVNDTGTITIAQLSRMTSLIKGTATFYHEEAHYALGRKARVNKEDTQAKGTLEDGRTFFSVQVVANWLGERENYIFHVEFK